MFHHRTSSSLIRALVMIVTLLSARQASAQEEESSAEESPAVETQNVEDLLQALTALDPSERAEAIETLRELGDPESVPALIRTLRSDPVAEVRGWAARALQEIGTPEARNAVVAAARSDSDQRVRNLAGRLSGTPPTPLAPPPAAHQPTPPYAHNAQQISPYGYQQQVPYAQQGVRYGRARSPGFGLRLAGWLTFGITYGASMFAAIGITSAGGANEGGWPLFLPLIGPAITGSMVWADDDDLAGVGILAWIISLAQIGGFTMAVMGHVRRARAREAAQEEESSSRRGVTLVASGPRGTPGLGLAGWF